ncbi:MAG: SDR family oxidoreductase [Jatrophihabitantaceae bacterium]
MTRRAVVTGSASGIGRTIAALLAEQGADVIGIDLKNADICADLATAGGRVAAVDAVRERVGNSLDVVVACAGISGNSPLVPSVNFFGVTELLTRLRPLLAAGTDPRAALISSVSSVHPVDGALIEACLSGDESATLERANAMVVEGNPSQLYSSSKAALARWVRRTAIAAGWAEAGIALNAVAPGVVLTPMTGEMVHDPVWKPIVDQAVPMPLNGYSPPEAIAALLGWLVGVSNTHVTGQVIFIDGGAEATLRGDVVW